MAVLRDQAFPLNNYPTGLHQIPWRIVEKNVTSLYFEIRRCTDLDPLIWPNEETKVKYDQEVSFDNGQTWIPAGGFGPCGGIYVNRFGQQVPISTITVPVPPQIGNNRRRLRATFEIINGPLYTEGFVELRS